jgi:hypothetical protein
LPSFDVKTVCITFGRILSSAAAGLGIVSVTNASERRVVGVAVVVFEEVLDEVAAEELKSGESFVLLAPVVEDCCIGVVVVLICVENCCCSAAAAEVVVVLRF